MLILRLILQRVMLGILTLFFVSVVIFSSLEMLPGGFAQAIMGQSATPEAVAVLNKEIGLDRPATTRYVGWITGILHGDFGSSYAGLGNGSMRRDVASLIGPRLYNTMILAMVAAFIAVPLALALGLMTAIWRDTWFDRAVNALALTTIALPEFFVAYLLMFVFAIKLRWFYSLSTVSASTGLLEHLSRALLPALTMTLVILAHMMRMTRGAIVNVLAHPYIEMARLKGVPLHRRVLRHALPNAWAPIITVIAVNLAYLIVGVVVVEVVFVYPGIGQLMVDAVSSRDMPVVQACAMIFAATYVVLNLIADILSTIANPRLMHPK